MAYTLQGQKGGTVRFNPRSSGTVSKESESYSSNVTSNPMEKGADTNDHVNNEPGTLSISGVIIGGMAAVKSLKAMREKRDIITYTGKTRLNNLVFTQLKFDYDYKNKKGASFSATFKKVNIVGSKSSDDNGSMNDQDEGKGGSNQLKKTGNAGLTTTSSQQVSKASKERHDASYSGGSSSSPFTQQTGGYDGLGGG